MMKDKIYRKKVFVLTEEKGVNLLISGDLEV